MRNLTRAFIFARGGSKGIPKKNLQRIGNIHLLGHSIKTAQKISEIKKIYVSTDCKEIAEVAKNYGAEVILRPKDLAEDNSPEILAWKHAVHYSMNKDGVFKKFLSLPPTSPLRNTQDVQNCLNAFVDDIDIVLTMSKSKRSPWFNMVRKEDSGLISLVNKKFSFERRQDTPPCYDLTTVAYVSSPSFILGAKSLWEGKVFGVEIPEIRSIDIDSPFDLFLAELIYRSNFKENE